jgi:hypothetical protein
MRFLLLAALLFAPLHEADACSCVERSFAEHAKTEKRVLLVRAGKPVKKGDALKQTFTVLATFKGPADKTFVHDRPATPPCASSHREGEIAILFTSGGDLDPCHGNVSLDLQVSQFVEIVTATKTKMATADGKGVDAALADVLQGYKAPNKNDVKILKSFTAGDVTFVRGKYEKEGLRFDSIVVRGDDGAWSAVYRRVVEV